MAYFILINPFQGEWHLSTHITILYHQFQQLSPPSENHLPFLSSVFWWQFTQTTGVVLQWRIQNEKNLFASTENFVVVVVVVVFSRQGFFVYPWLSWNSLCRPGWPRTQKSACLCLPSAGIKGVHHHARLTCNILSILHVLTHSVVQGHWENQLLSSFNEED